MEKIGEVKLGTFLGVRQTGCVLVLETQGGYVFLFGFPLAQHFVV